MRFFLDNCLRMQFDTSGISVTGMAILILIQILIQIPRPILCWQAGPVLGGRDLHHLKTGSAGSWVEDTWSEGRGRVCFQASRPAAAAPKPGRPVLGDDTRQTNRCLKETDIGSPEKMFREGPGTNS